MPETFRVRVTADNRYELFVNGQRVGRGPARGDVAHWRYDTIELAPHLRDGSNVLAAVVWYLDRDLAPMAQIGLEPAFLVCADPEDDAAAVVNTPEGWRCTRNPAYTFEPLNRGDVRGYYVAGPTERVDAASYPWGWERPDFDDNAWEAPRRLDAGAPRGSRDAHSPWMLVANPLPPMERTLEPAGAVVRSEGAMVENHRISPDQPLTLPAGARATILLDRGHLTTGYPELEVEGGAGSTVRLRFAEALLGGPKQDTKGNRGEIEGKVLQGYADTFLPDGPRRVFRPLWWRTYRYLQVEVEVGDAPITLHDLRDDFTAYPFEERGRFAASDKGLTPIWDVGWRTARLCAMRRTWTAPITSSSSTPAIPGSSASSRTMPLGTPGWPVTPSPSLITRASPKGSPRVVIPASSCRSSRRSPCGGSG